MKSRWKLTLGLCLAALALTGCDLYIEDTAGEYYYCDDWGCYYCDDWGCYADDGGAEPGSLCTTDADCAGGCYCTRSGYCEEAGFCEVNEDCAVGFYCDPKRASCIPDPDSPDNPDVRGCTSDDQCPGEYVCDQGTGLCQEFVCASHADCDEGSYCDETSGECVASTSCTENADCGEGQECDEGLGLCLPDDGICETDDDCTGVNEVCDTETGECALLTCGDIDNEADCFDRQDCSPVYSGNNCTDPDGNLCSASEANCTCESFTFLLCAENEGP